MARCQFYLMEIARRYLSRALFCDISCPIKVLGHSDQMLLRHGPSWTSGPNGQKLILQANLYQIFWPLVRIPPPQRDYAAITFAVTSIERELTIAEKVLATHAFIAGDDFSSADIQPGHCLYRYYDIDVVRADLPHLRAYYERLRTTEGFISHTMVSYDKLRVTTR